MARILFCFLGTNAYVHCSYKFNDVISAPVRYVQEALALHLCKEWTSDDRIVVLGTEDVGSRKGSVSRNWDTASFCKQDEETAVQVEHAPQGLKDRLNALSLRCKIEMLPIPDATESGDLWEVIRTISSHVGRADTVYFDITHSFRFLPMVVPSIISFLKRTKEMIPGGIYYGAFETLGDMNTIVQKPLEQRIAPVRDLMELYEMTEWGEAVQAILDNGDERLLQKIIREKQQPDGNSRAIRKISGYLKAIEKGVGNVGTALRLTDVKELKKIPGINIPALPSMDEMPQLYPLTELLEKIHSLLQRWHSDDIANGFEAATWCIEHQRMAQALTFTHEAAKGYFCKRFGWNPNTVDHREAVSYLLRIYSKELDRDKNPTAISGFSSRNPETEKWFKESAHNALQTLEGESIDFCKSFAVLGGWRNTVNHSKSGDRSRMMREFPELLGIYKDKYHKEFQIESCRV
ncbi:MAG: TIGR02221 family CRISPR-associated protein [Deltaproteobacteria bacterium]|nr:TIGR02221 family CRISPR-associated protein [Deltaproteobacteria bacterium]